MSSIIQSNPHHRKIELQSPLDLTHLQTQLSTSARQKLDLHFPPTALNFKPATHIALGGGAPPAPSTSTTSPQDENEEDPDPLRAHVSRLVTAFLQRTWTAAAPSISINGLDAHTLPQFTSSSSTSSTTTNPKPVQTKTDPELETEGIHYNHAPYDARLQTRLAELYGELEGLTAQVARLRREAPGRGAEAWLGSLKGEVQGDEEAFERARQQAEVAAEEEDGGEKQGKGEGWRKGWDAERHGEVRGAFEVAVGELARLRGMGVGVEEGVTGGGGTSAGAGAGSGISGVGELGGLTATSGKLRRARMVAEELE